ncbi:MAG TPA: hypothetical protein VK808_07275, partial [Bacteroidia bacterium]|nr:hypothetical protein [Bacteroidia bacterium]
MSATKTGKSVIKKSYLHGLQGMTQERLEEELQALYQLQNIDSLVDEIRVLRGELPVEVEELEATIDALKLRIAKQQEEMESLDKMITEKKNAAKDSQTLIKKYESQQNKVRNNREFESLTKELEFQKLEIQLSDKRVKEYKASITAKEELMKQSEALLAEK